MCIRRLPGLRRRAHPIQMVLDRAALHREIEKVSLGVLSNSPRGIHLYATLGFQVEGRLRGEYKFPDGQQVDNLQMARFVKPLME